MISITNDQRVGDWVAAKVGGRFIEGHVIGLLRDERIIAGTVYDRHNGASIQMHTAIAGRPTYEWYWFCFYYPFVQLRLRKVIAPVSSGNPAAVGFVLNVGFQLEARIANAYPNGDLLAFTMTPNQCRFLEKRNESKRHATSTCGA